MASKADTITTPKHKKRNANILPKNSKRNKSANSVYFSSSISEYIKPKDKKQQLALANKSPIKDNFICLFFIGFRRSFVTSGA